MVLMLLNQESIAIRKDQSSDRFWVDKQLRADEQTHHLAELRVMSKGVKSFKIEDLLVDCLECRIRITAGRLGVRHALHGVLIWQQPVFAGEDLHDLAQQIVDIVDWQ